MNRLDVSRPQKIRQYDKMLIALCAIYPVIPPYFKILGFSFPYICYIILIVCSFLDNRLKLRYRRNALSTVLLLWMAVNVLLYCYHYYFYGAVWNILLVVAGITLGNALRDRYTFVRILLTVCYVTGGICIFGIIEALTGLNIWTVFNNSGALININPPRFGLTRIVSFTYQTISYCTFLVLVSCLVMYLLSIREYVNRKQRNQLKGIYGLIVINIVLTLSRSAILIFIISQMMILYGLGAKKLLKTIAKVTIVGVIALFIMSIAVPEVFHTIRNIYYMIMAVFDSDYTSLIVTEFGNDNLNAIGTRLDIYKWVYEKIGNKVWLGVGFDTPFSYEFDSGNIWHTMLTKSSIEVEYLLTFYETGYIGLASEVVVFATIIIMACKKKFTPSAWEGKMGFNYIMFVVMVCLVVQYFMVNQSSEQFIFFLIIALFIAYNNHKKFDMQ